MEIYGTLGPKCAQTDTLRAMFDAGMTGVRLNLSHVTLKEAKPQIETLQNAARLAGVEYKLLIDMQGPELRIGRLDAPIRLVRGEYIPLDAIPLPETVRPYLVPGQELLLDDGKILLTVGGSGARVERGGVLTGRKSVALPGADVYPPTMTGDDLANIAVAADYGVTGVMQPFVRSRADLEAVRAALDNAGGGDIRLFAKIENLAGVAALAELIGACDEIVIARGDLGNAVPLHELPAVQKRIAAECRARGRAFTVVTQMLSSMEHSPVPTRAEVSDIFNAVLDGASSVMVTGETAIGDYPVEVIKYLAATAREGERYVVLIPNRTV